MDASDGVMGSVAATTTVILLAKVKLALRSSAHLKVIATFFMAKSVLFPDLVLVNRRAIVHVSCTLGVGVHAAVSVDLHQVVWNGKLLLVINCITSLFLCHSKGSTVSGSDTAKINNRTVFTN